jgi:tripartite-type tricarboxylate transporter receptor subunit TctC
MAHTALRSMIALAAASALMLSHAAAADPVADFYRGKQIRMIIAFGPGGGYDLYARLLAKHMSRFIPGNPTFIAQNMPGAGSMIGAQYMMHQAPHDGTAVAMLSKDSPMNIVVNNSPDKAAFAKLNWIGNVSEDNYIMTVWAKTGVKSVEDATRTELSMGATAANGAAALYPHILNNIFGTKFRVIAGFSGSTQLYLAMERGEIDGRGSDSWVTLRSTKPEWLRDKKINVLMQMGFRRDKNTADIPLMIDLARSPVERMLFEMLSASARVGASLLTTADVPVERLGALRAAFNAVMKDPQFLADAEHAKLEVNPLPGEEVQEAVSRTVNASKEILDLLTAATAKGKAFNCAEAAKDQALCDR